MKIIDGANPSIGLRLLCQACHHNNSPQSSHSMYALGYRVVSKRSLPRWGETTRGLVLRTFGAASGVVDAPQPALTESVLANTTVRCLGDLPYGSRQYRLIQSSDGTCLASLRAHRNVLFAATLEDGGVETSSALKDLCRPLVRAALEDASAQGEQPQALATLHGLCSWVSSCLNGKDVSEALRRLQEAQDLVALEAVQAIATGEPRPGHSVVGLGTFRDGHDAWQALAREFAPQAQEVDLYRCEGAEVVGIEQLTHTREEYLKSAGGAMARLFFL